VGIDRSDDADVPSGEHSDRSADHADTASDGRQPTGSQAETRSRQECYNDLRAADAAKDRPKPEKPTEPEEPTEPGGQSEPRARSKSEEQFENGQRAQEGASWEEKAERFHRIWAMYKLKWPSPERAPVDESTDHSGSWHGEGGKVLEKAVNDRIEAECDRIEKREKEKILPAIRDIESQDSDRSLIGLEHHLKGRDRIKEKIYDDINLLGRSEREAISLLPDALRYTFQYEEARYTHGVLTDVARMKEQGFELLKLKNFWSDDQYKGVNSQWIEPVCGQRFELQFHTRISFEAKQITHPAYERLRTKQADELEELVLEALQGKVAAAVPIPPGATELPDYPEREQHAR
jgi:hypothetical protein